MNIVLYVNSFLPHIGGRELVVHYLARSFKELGHRVRVVLPGGWLSHRKICFEYPVHRWPTLRGIFKEQVWFTQLLLDTTLWGCDVIHAHITYPSAYIAARLKRIKRLPLIVTPHGIDIHTIPELDHGLRLNPILRPKIYEALQRTDIVTCISASIEESVLDAGGISERIRRISNGVDIERFQCPAEENVREWLALPPTSRLILTVGAYYPRKGHEILIRAMPRILEKESRAYLIIVGRNTEELQPLIRELHLADRVILVREIPHPAARAAFNTDNLPNQDKDLLAAIYCSSDVYVCASIADGAEGLSLAVLEAMSAKLPVVATDISGNRDIIQDGENGLLIQPGDPELLAGGVLQILQSEESRIRMGEKAKRMAIKHHWHEIARRYLAVYEEAQNYNKKG